MGILSIYLVYNDALSCIENDPEFGKNVSEASSAGYPRTLVSIGARDGNCTCANAASFIGSIHSHDDGFVFVSGNTAEMLSWRENQHLKKALETFRRDHPPEQEGD